MTINAPEIQCRADEAASTPYEIEKGGTSLIVRAYSRKSAEEAAEAWLRGERAQKDSREANLL